MTYHDNQPSTHSPHFNPQHLGPLQQWTRTTMTGRTEEVNLFPSQPRTKSILSGHHIPPTWYPKRLPCDFEDFGIPNNISSNLVGNYENHPWATSLASPISQSLMTMFNKCLVKHIFFHGNDLESTLTETALLIRGCFEYQVHIFPWTLGFPLLPGTVPIPSMGLVYIFSYIWLFLIFNGEIW